MMDKNISNTTLIDLSEKEIIIRLINKLCKKVISVGLSDNYKDYSLISGKAGIAIALYHSGIVLNNETYTDYSKHFLDNAILNFDKLPNTSFCGIAGVLWANDYLTRRKIVSDFSIDLKDVDYYYSQQLDKVTDYDLFTGLLGYGQYFLMRNSTTKQNEQLKKIVDNLLKLSINSAYGKTWMYSHPRDLINCINLGLAHGIPSILSFFLKCEVSIEDNESTLLMSIKEIINFLHKAKITENSTSSYPNYLDLNCRYPENRESRLAWCYGDLGIAYVLLQAGKMLRDNNIYLLAKEIITKSIYKKRDLSGVVDSSFCHGTSGVLFLYHCFYEHFNIDECKFACSYWLNEIINEENYAINNEPFFFYDGTKMVEQLGILEGYSGVILTLLAIYGDIDNEWKSMFLL